MEWAFSVMKSAALNRVLHTDPNDSAACMYSSNQFNTSATTVAHACLSGPANRVPMRRPSCTSSLRMFVKTRPNGNGRSRFRSAASLRPSKKFSSRFPCAVASVATMTWSRVVALRYRSSIDQQDSASSQWCTSRSAFSGCPAVGRGDERLNQTCEISRRVDNSLLSSARTIVVVKQENLKFGTKFAC
jgi:hypothetical protein